MTARDPSGESCGAGDALTGLPLRGAFLESVSSSIQGLSERSGRAALIYVDIDGLRSVNSTADPTRGEPGFLFVRGESGVGRTRLLREFSRLAREENVPVAFCTCGPADPMKPYAALARALADCADAGGEARDTLLSDLSRDEMEVLVPLFARAGVPLFPGGREGPRSAAFKQ